MANQIVPFARIFSEIYDIKDTSYEKVFLGLFSTAHFLLVKRMDKVSQAVSRLMARLTKSYHSAVHDGDEELKKIVGSNNLQADREEVSDAYDYNTISQEIEKIEQEEKFLDELIVNFNLDVENLIYEDVVENRDYVLRVAKKFGESNVDLGDRRLKKIGGNISKAWVSRYNLESETK